jgi:RING-H2 zinc finger protein RHA1
MMGIPLVCYCLVVPKPVIAFCRLLSAAKDTALLMLAVVGLCRLPPDDEDDGHQHHQPGEVKTRLPAVEYDQLLAEHEQQSDNHYCDGEAVSAL